MIKFAIFIACAFVTVKGGVFDDIIEAIDITLPEIIQKIKNKISDDDLNLITEIKEKIEERIKNAGEVGRKCADDQKSKIESLKMFTEAGTKVCVKEAESEIEALRQKLEDLLVREDLATAHDITMRSISSATQSAREADAALTECSNHVQEKVVIETDHILSAISNCIIAPDL